MPDQPRFAWGTGASAVELWGAAPESDWARWESLGRAPRSGNGIGFDERCADDFALLADIGATHFRLTLDWARLEPQQGRPDDAAWEALLQVLDAADRAGVAIWACLLDRALPGWFSEEGGFGDDKARGYWWPRFVDQCAERIGDRVHAWIPVYEPFRTAWAGFRTGVHPPGKRDPERFAETVEGLLLAQRDAGRLLHGGPPVATAFDVAPVFRADATLPARDHAAELERLLWDSWVTALRDGHLVVPGRPRRDEVPGLTGCCDLVGFTYRGAIAVDETGALRPHPPSARVDDLGWAPDERGLAEVLHRVGELLPDRPLVVHTGLGTDDDAWRVASIQAWTTEVAGARADGIDVRGFFYDSPIDSYQWLHGRTVRTGLFDRERRARDSAHAFAEVAR